MLSRPSKKRGSPTTFFVNADLLTWNIYRTHVRARTHTHTLARLLVQMHNYLTISAIVYNSDDKTEIIGDIIKVLALPQMTKITSIV